MKQVAGSAALHAGLRSHAIRRIQFQTARQADLVRRVLRTARQTFKLVHISNQQDFGRNSLYFSQLFSSSSFFFHSGTRPAASPLVRHMLLVDPAKRANVEDICSHW